jgi:hypothetical protein
LSGKHSRATSTSSSSTIVLNEVKLYLASERVRAARARTRRPSSLLSDHPGDRRLARWQRRTPLARLPRQVLGHPGSCGNHGNFALMPRATTIALMPRATADSAVLLPSRVRAHRIAVTRVACCRVALLSRPPGAIGSGVPGYVAVAVCVPCRLCRGLHGPLRVMCLVGVNVNMRCECEHEV